MEFNVGLSQAAIDAIDASPELFDQTSWLSYTEEECGTAHCWYGWCLVLEGYDFRELSFNSEILGLAESTIGLNPQGKKFRRITDGSNTIEDIKFYHAKLAAGESIEFDRFGYDFHGYDRDGFDSEGDDEEGYDRAGYNCHGVTREGKFTEDSPCRFGQIIFEPALFSETEFGKWIVLFEQNAAGTPPNPCDWGGSIREVIFYILDHHQDLYNKLYQEWADFNQEEFLQKAAKLLIDRAN